MGNTKFYIVIVVASLLGIVTVWAMPRPERTVQQQICILDSLIRYWNHPGFYEAFYNRCMQLKNQ